VPLVLVGFVAILALVATACGGGGGSKVSAAPSSTTVVAGRNAAALQAYRDCLSQHGVNVPADFGARRDTAGGPGGPGRGISRTIPPGVDATKFAAARQACRSKLPAGFGQGGGRFRQAFQAYLSCLRDHGVAVPALTPTAPGGPGQSAALFRDDPKFASANAICAALLPARGITPTTTSSPA
jgi:hypothetical protein